MEGSSDPIPSFKEVTRLDVLKLTDEEIIEQVHEICVEQGIPLVIENYHLKEEFDSELFNITWLQQNYGSHGLYSPNLLPIILVKHIINIDSDFSAAATLKLISKIITRDMNKNLDENMSLAEYFNYVEETRKNSIPAEQMLYGKDIICPNPWKDYSIQNPSFSIRMKNSPGRNLQKEYKILLGAYKHILDQEWVSSSQWEEDIHIPTTGSAYDICLECYTEHRGCIHPLQLRDGFKMQRIINAYNNAKQAYISEWGDDEEIEDLEDLDESVGSLAYNRWKVSRKLKKGEQLAFNNAAPNGVFIGPYMPIFEEPVKMEKVDRPIKRAVKKKVRRRLAKDSSIETILEKKNRKRKTVQKAKDQVSNLESHIVKRSRVRSSSEKERNSANRMDVDTNLVTNDGSTGGNPRQDGNTDIGRRPEDCDY
ncbi:11631_t:CDS:2, partial [Acaulospora colombiana]